MTFFPGIADDGHLLPVFNRFPKGLDPLLALHDDVLRGTSDLTKGEHEMIAFHEERLAANEESLNAGDYSAFGDMVKIGQLPD